MKSGFQATFVARIEALGRISERVDVLMRPSFTPAMKQANALVAEWMQAAGMTVHEDAVSNLIGRYEGTSPNAKTLLIGSHIDTVIDAGKYDGTLGVLLGLACVEELAAHNKRLPYAIEVIAFCDEEGLRFHQSYIGSRTFTGALTLADLERADADGITLRQAIDTYGGLPPLAAEAPNAGRIAAYLEAHIEQGPALEATGAPVGIVTGIQGANRLDISFTGEAGHAGTVPVQLRRDALVAAARFIVAVNETAKATAGLVATVGQIQALPGASNAIPGKAILSLDIRHMSADVRQNALAALQATAADIAAAERVTMEWNVITDTASIPCAPEIVDAFTQAVSTLGLEPVTLASGAGHDGVMVSRIAPVGMLFVRCQDGISHNPAEYCAPEDAETAADVLFGTVLALADTLSLG